MPDTTIKDVDYTPATEGKTAIFRSLVGEKAPVFLSRSTTGEVSLDDYLGQWVMLFFHPADFTPVCTSEFVRLAQRKSEFDALNTQLIGISVDSIYAHMAWVRWMEEHYNIKIDFPIVEDVSMTIARAYGLINDDSNSTSGARACCFINPQGVIEAKIHYPMQLGRSVDELLRVQKALIEIEKTGMTCPVDWQDGGRMLDYPAEDMRQMEGDWLQQSMKNFDF